MLTAFVLAAQLAQALRQGNHNANSLKDATQLQGIHQSWLTFARDFKGQYPTPGLLQRLPVGGVIVPGRGAEDTTKNTTADLFSACIMHNLFTPELCIGTTEPSKRVQLHTAYNYLAYSPSNCVFWDSSFQADLHNVSHVSYAHAPLRGDFKLRNWRNTMDRMTPMLGNRGPLGGVHDPNSITNKIHKPYDQWSGHIVANDNHVQTVTRQYPSRPRPADGGWIIAPESLAPGRQPPNTDALLTFTKEMTEQGPIVQHD